MSDAKPKNKFFTKPAWLKDQALNKVKNDSKPDEKNDATSIFARSTGTVSDVLAEQKRKEAVKAEKKAQKAKIKEDADAPRRKRRKTSEEGDYEGGRVKKYDGAICRHHMCTDSYIETQFHQDTRSDQTPAHRQSHFPNAMKPLSSRTSRSRARL